jgi:hypothetical protein
MIYDIHFHDLNNESGQHFIGNIQVLRAKLWQRNNNTDLIFNLYAIPGLFKV